MKQLNTRLDNESFETIENLCEKLGVSKTDFVKEALHFFMTIKGHELNRRSQKHFLDVRIKRDQQELFFLSNFNRRIVMQVMSRCVLRAECDIAIPQKIVSDAEEYYDTLTEDNKKILLPDLKYLQQFKEKYFFDQWVETRLPEEVKNVQRRKLK